MEQWPGFDATDFHQRWTRARTSVLNHIISQVNSEGNAKIEAVEGSEATLLTRIPKEQRETLLRQVFDVSRKFAMNVARHFGVQWELQDIRDILSRGPIPCCQGVWENRGLALTSRQAGCTIQSAAGSMACDYFREALDGLIMGLCVDERIARHASMGHGDDHCLDVYFTDSSAGTTQGLRMGPIPDPVKNRTTEVIAKLAKQGQRLEFHGYAEGVLFYSLAGEKGPTCGAAGRYFHDLVSKEIGAVFPHFRLQDSAPLAVYGEGTK